MTISRGEDGSVMIEIDRDGIHVGALVHEGKLDLYVESERDGWEFEEEADINPVANEETVQ